MEEYPNAGGAPSNIYQSLGVTGVVEEASTPHIEKSITYLGPFKLF